MTQKKNPGYVKSENVIWFVVAALLIGFVGGVAFGIYKTGTIADPHQHASAPPADAEIQKAIEALKAKTTENPKDLDAWIELGHRYFDTDRQAEAIAAYETALAIDPQNANVWTDLGVMYRRSGDPQKAVDAFDRAMEIDPSHQISRFNKGLVLFHDMQDETGAVAAWESLLAINPDAKAPNGQSVKELVAHIKSNHDKNG